MKTIHSWMAYLVGIVSVVGLALLKGSVWPDIPFIEATSSVTSLTLAYIAKRHLDKKINGGIP